MNASELRIGNWVNTELKGIEQVVDVLCDSVNASTQEGIPLGCFEPIPLDEEWLSRFGFEYKPKSFRWVYGDLTEPMYLYRMELISHCVGSFLYMNMNHHIKHVHQLQNLYFALSGEELKIKES